MKEEPLVYETHGIVGEGRWFRLYECPHVTDGSFPIALCVNLGEHVNFIFCRHCWQDIKGLVAEEIIHKEFQSLPSERRDSILHRLLNADEPEVKANPFLAFGPQYHPESE